MIDVATVLHQHYAIAVTAVTDAARGLVAETFIATSTSGARYFVKITRMPFFKCRIPTSMPGHAALAQLLPDAVSHPVATRSGQWHVALADAMVTVCDFVDAPLYETYDTAHFGRLIGRIHNSTPAIAIHLPRVQFFCHHAQLKHLLNLAFDGDGTAPWQTTLTARLAPYRADAARYYQRLCDLEHAAAQQPAHPWVVTHGDAGGNVIGSAHQGLMLVDWDYCALAAPERDLWVFQYDAEFWRGYREVVGDYPIDPYRLQLASYRQYFDYVLFILSEIYLMPADRDRTTMIDNLLSLFADGWVQPHLV
jgi:hypothetical protein